MEKLLNELLSEFKGFKSEFNGLKIEFTDLKSEINHRIDKMDNKFTEKFLEVNERLDRIDTKLDSTKEVAVDVKENQYMAFGEMKEMNKNIKVLLQNSSNHEQQLFRLSIKNRDTEH